MNKAVLEQFEIFCGRDVKGDNWLWCNRCHRCYRAYEFRILKEDGKIFLLCHYKDCDGDLPLDSRLWDSLTSDDSKLPKIPQRGKCYDLELSFDKSIDVTPEEEPPNSDTPKDIARWTKVNYLWDKILEET